MLPPSRDLGFYSERTRRVLFPVAVFCGAQLGSALVTSLRPSSRTPRQRGAKMTAPAPSGSVGNSPTAAAGRMPHGAAPELDFRSAARMEDLNRLIQEFSKHDQREYDDQRALEIHTAKDFIFSMLGETRGASALVQVCFRSAGTGGPAPAPAGAAVMLLRAQHTRAGTDGAPEWEAAGSPWPSWSAPTRGSCLGAWRSLDPQVPAFVCPEQQEACSRTPGGAEGGQ